jgi:protein involved in polysaccharide export with SLBB domain
MVESAAQQLRANNYKKGDLQYGLSVGDIVIIIVINWATLVADGLDIYAAAVAAEDR